MSLGLSETFLDPVGTQPVCYLDYDPRSKIRNFLLECPNAVQPRKCLINPSNYSFLASDRNSFSPLFDITEVSGHPATPPLGTICSERSLRQGDHSMALRTL